MLTLPSGQYKSAHSSTPDADDGDDSNYINLSFAGVRVGMQFMGWGAASKCIGLGVFGVGGGGC